MGPNGLEAESLAGKTVGQYQVLRQLGRGGMGIVYEAREAALNRYVALKVLRRGVAQYSLAVKRFLREARAAAQLSHPNIVHVYSVGEQEGIYYIAMEYVRGNTLRRQIRKAGSLELGQALNITAQVASALAEAHRCGIVHRDIKPSNIMIDKAGSVKVMDFGLAKILQSTVHLTEAGRHLGTPRYMSPEQCQGDPLDHRTDIYSLGVCLYYALAGRPPFDTENTVALIYRIVKEPIPRLRTVNPDIPRSVDMLIAKMCAKNPEERYSSAQAVYDDVRAVLLDDTQARMRLSFSGVPGAASPSRGEFSSDDRLRKEIIFEATPLHGITPSETPPEMNQLRSEIVYDRTPSLSPEPHRAASGRETLRTGLGDASISALRWGVPGALLVGAALAMLSGVFEGLVGDLGFYSGCVQGAIIGGPLGLFAGSLCGIIDHQGLGALGGSVAGFLLGGLAIAVYGVLEMILICQSDYKVFGTLLMGSLAGAVVGCLLGLFWHR